MSAAFYLMFFPLSADIALLWTVINPLRRERVAGFKLTQGPVTLPPDWTLWVHREIDKKALEALHHSINRSRPFGDAEWIIKTARKMGFRINIKKKRKTQKKYRTPLINPGDIPRKRTIVLVAVILDKVGSNFDRKNASVFGFVMRFKPHRMVLS